MDHLHTELAHERHPSFSRYGAQIKAKTMLANIEQVTIHEACVAEEFQLAEYTALQGILENCGHTGPQLQHNGSLRHCVGSHGSNTLPIESTIGLYESHGSPLLSIDVPGAAFLTP